MSSLLSPAYRDTEPKVPASLIESVCDLLSPENPEERRSLQKALRLIGVAYLRDASFDPEYGEPKQQRRALRKLRESIVRAYADTLCVAPEYAVALDQYIELNPDGTKSFLHAAQVALAELHQAITVFDARYKPGKGPNPDLPLEEAVRDLAFLIEELDGKTPRAKMNKHLDCQPELVSTGSRAIGLFLKGLDGIVRANAPLNSHLVSSR